jgi:subtilisin family serine protease
MRGSAALPLRFRAAVLTVAAAVLLGGLGTAAPARAEDAPTAPAPESAAAPVDPLQEVDPVVPAPEPSSTDGEVVVSAVVVTDDGAGVITRAASPAEVPAVAADLRDEPGVVSVSVDSRAHITETVAGTDPWRAEQWGNDELQLNDLPAGTANGAGIKVAVLDTGVLATHPDLAGRVRCDLGADFTENAQLSTGNGCIDPQGHGTHVAGTVGAISGNWIGVEGVSAAEIIPVRVLGSDGFGWTSGITAGILYAVDHGASIISMSLGGDGPDDYASAVQYAVDHGVVVVAAAGNSRQKGNAPSYPAATPGVFSVASMDEDRVSSSFSNSGSTNFITAPGRSILSTTIDGGYGYKSGTSMATPHVSGVLARYRQAHPQATVAQIRSAVQATADDIESPGRDDNTGYGLIDAYQLLTGQESAPRVTPPGVPTNAQARRGAGSLTVTWDPPSSTGGSPVLGYGLTLYEGFGETFVEYYPFAPSERSLTLSGIDNGTGYSFSLYAWNAKGPGSAIFVDAEPGPPDAPTAPGAPAVGAPVAGNGAVTVRWTAPVDNGGSAVTGYTVRAYRGSTLVKTVTAAATASSAAVSGLVNGATYTFTVAAANAAGAGPESTRSAAATPRTVPGAPVPGTLSAGNGAVTVRWAAPASTGGSAVTGYTVRAYSGSTLVKTATTAATAASWTVTGLTNGTAYTFTVAAANAVGAGPESARSAAVRPAAPTAPGAPVAGAPVAGNGAVTVRWTAPVNTGGSAVTGYAVRAYSGSTLAKTVTVAATATSVTVSGLTNGTAYTFTVSASNGVGAGPGSPRTAAVTPRTVPGVPTVGTVSAGNGAVTVRWTAPAKNGGSAVTGYTVRAYRGSTLVKTVSATAAATSATVSGLVNGAGHTFTVAAGNAAGAGPESARTATVTPRTVAGAPGIGAAAPGNGAVTVRWTAPASTGGSPVTGYTVRAYRGSTLVRTVTAPAAATSATVGGLVNGTGYTFTVAAGNAVGAGPESARTATVTPRTSPGTP